MRRLKMLETLSAVSITYLNDNYGLLAAFQVDISRIDCDKKAGWIWKKKSHNNFGLGKR